MNNSVLAVMKSRFPGFVARKYPDFEKFMSAYFDFLEQDGEVINYLTNFMDNNDTSNEQALYWDNILSDLGWALGVELKIEKRVFILFLRDYYTSRGSFNSLKFLFKIIFDDEPEVDYPRDDLLMTSNSKYVGKIIMFVKDDNLGANELRKLQQAAQDFSLMGEGILSKSKMLIDSVVLNLGFLKLTISATDEFVSGESIKLIGPDFEFITENVPCLDLNPIGSIIPIEDGESVHVTGALYNGVITVNGVADGKIDSIEISDGGSGYSVGEVISANESCGFFARVAEVDVNGKINKIKVTNHGYGLKYIPSIYVRNSNGVGAVLEAISSTIGRPRRLNMIEPIIAGTQFIAGEVQFDDMIFDAKLNPIFISNSEWKNDNHIVGNNAVLIDSYYYQQFSYRVISETPMAEYEHIVKNEVHPTGYVLFSKLKLNNKDNIILNISDKVEFK